MTCPDWLTKLPLGCSTSLHHTLHRSRSHRAPFSRAPAPRGHVAALRASASARVMRPFDDEPHFPECRRRIELSTPSFGQFRRQALEHTDCLGPSLPPSSKTDRLDRVRADLISGPVLLRVFSLSPLVYPRVLPFLPIPPCSSELLAS